MNKTLEQFREVVGRCRELFEHKTADYGTAWRILRPSSITDQLYIKAMRIRSIEEKGQQKVSDPVEAEFIGLVNYSILALVQLETDNEVPLELPLQEAVSLYDRQVEENLRLLQNKNHDYGEAWRQMRISSMTDLILQKLLRIKQIEDNSGATLVSEGVAANYRDIINYAVFCLIKMEEARQMDS
ncbi:MAG: DUF1599 domain-containing protein [Bacteroidota bacterium]